MVENQNFGQAIEALKEGKRVARHGWNGKGMFVFKQVPSQIDSSIIPKMQSLPDSVKKAFSEQGCNIEYENQFCIVKPVRIGENVAELNGWAPSGSDTLATDWVVLD